MNGLGRLRPGRKIVGRLGWGVADQAVSSLENFLLGVYVANALGAESLGALGLAFFAYGIALSCSRALATDALMIRFAAVPVSDWRAAASAASGVALLVGTAAGSVCAGVGVALRTMRPESAAGAAFLAMGIALPGLILQDSWRCAFFAAGHGAKAFANDLLWTILLVAVLVTGHLAGTGDLTWSLLGFGGTALVAAVWGMVQARTVPRVRAASGWLRRHRDLGARFLVENVVLGMGGQFRAVVVAGAVGLVAVGAIRGAEMLVGPIAALLMGISQVAVPEAARALRRSTGALLRLCIALSLGLGSIAVCWGLVVLVVFPFGIGETLLGPVWPDAHGLVLGVIVSMAAGCLHLGPSAGLRALGRADKTMRSQLAVTGLLVALGSAGAAVQGAAGAVWGTAVASVLGAGIWWWQLGRARREHHLAAELAEIGRPATPADTTGASA